MSDVKQLKRVCEDEVTHLLTQAEEGNINPLDVYAIFKQSKILIDEAIEQVEPLAQSEAIKYPERTFEQSGFTFEKRNGATRYSYDHIPEIFELNQKLKYAQAKYKHAYLSQQKGLLTASKDGEEMIMPKVTYSKDSLIVKKQGERAK
tara:strand:- start:789 stop:1232 length:444 start_codon:yes stop_codon:yes gene_type:complete